MSISPPNISRTVTPQSSPILSSSTTITATEPTTLSLSGIDGDLYTSNAAFHKVLDDSKKLLDGINAGLETGFLGDVSNLFPKTLKRKNSWESWSSKEDLGASISDPGYGNDPRNLLTAIENDERQAKTHPLASMKETLLKNKTILLDLRLQLKKYNQLERLFLEQKYTRNLKEIAAWIENENDAGRFNQITREDLIAQNLKKETFDALDKLINQRKFTPVKLKILMDLINKGDLSVDKQELTSRQGNLMHQLIKRLA